jgi:TM2 domain-containing membrane protein YozV
MQNSAQEHNYVVAACLAFFLGAIGADFFYRRKFVEGACVLGLLVLGYVITPVGTDGIGRHIPTLLGVYGWVRTFLYIKNRAA